MTTALNEADVHVVDVAVDVSPALSGQQTGSVSGTMFVPENLDPAATVVVATPGASLSRRYWDIELPDGEYSQARHFARRGVVFIALDYLGGGDSSQPANGEQLTLPDVAAAAHHALVGLRRGLEQGSWHPRPLTPSRWVGLGHSFGAAITIVQQSEYADFDAIAVLGYSSIESAAVPQVPANWADLSVVDRRAFVEEGLARYGINFPVYHQIPREGPWAAMYPDDASDQLKAYDDEVLATTLPRTVGVDVMTPGFTLPYASRITAPVFLAFGDQDTCRQPHLQVTAYPASRDVTLTTYQDMKHLHNFSDGRLQLWDRTVQWMTALR